MTRIYTRTGDDGLTYCYFLKKRIPKDHPVIEFIGTLDEANSSIGLARSFLKESDSLKEIDDVLREVQRLLFQIGFLPSNSSSLDDKDVQLIEKKIDEVFTGIKLDSFILPTGHPAASQIHVARTIIRRSERRLVKLVREGVYPDIALKLLNRIGDLLFVLALKVNKLSGINEEEL